MWDGVGLNYLISCTPTASEVTNLWQYRNVCTVFALIEAGSQIQAVSLIEAGEGGRGLRVNTLPDW